MFKVLLGCMMFGGIGALVIWRGKEAIKNKFMANSIKSAAITGITHFEGEKAVFHGKITVVLGWIIVSGAGLVAVGAVSLSFVEYAAWFVAPRTSRTTVVTNSGDFSSSFGAEPEQSRATQGRTINQPRDFAAAPIFDNGRSDTLAGDSSANEGQVVENRDNNARQVEEFDHEAAAEEVQNAIDEAQRDMADMREMAENEMRNRTAPGSRRFGANNLSGNRGRGDSVSRNRDQAQSSPRASVTDPLTSIGSPEQAFPKLIIAPNRTIKSNLVGFGITDTKMDDAPKYGSVLVGMVVGCKSGTGPIDSLCPIYQCGDEYALGKTFGSKGGDQQVIIAPRGYAVTGLQAKSSIGICLLRLAFMELKPDGKLDKKTLAFSDWFGNDRPGVKLESIDSEGKLIASVHGGLIHNRLGAIGLTAARRVKVDDSSPVRTWNSANGKFSVNAEYVSHENGTVRLKKSDGSVLEVEIQKLGSADQKWLTERE